LNKTINSIVFESISQCSFEERLKLCNKSNYQIKEIWGIDDSFFLNKRVQIVFKISKYLMSLTGIVTNLLVILVIWNKNNTDLFKQFRQYSYLWLNSLFNIFILVIEILSWMTECFYPFEVFCPEIRKLIFIQYIKIIFVECLVTAFRFMSNFTYVAFALNRISLL